MFGICLLSHIAGRREGSDKSEMVTQLLFGDAYAVVEVQEKWVKIKTHFDDYDCWISKNQHFEITEKTYGELLSAPLVLSDDLVQVVQEGSTYLPIVMGSTLPLFKDGELKLHLNYRAGRCSWRKIVLSQERTERNDFKKLEPA